MKSALITGASRGIGRGIAFSLARQGYGLTITSRSQGDLEKLAAELADSGAPRVTYHAIDMEDPMALIGLTRVHEKAFDSMTALIVNAGVGTAGPVASFPINRLHKTVAVNFTAPFVLIQDALPLLRSWAATEPAGAKIIAISSIVGAFAEPGLAAYGASKAALLSLIETVNQEESGAGITASAVAPAYVETDMSAWVIDEIPADTMIPVSDVVAVVDMLVALGRTTAIPRIVMARSGTRGHSA